VSSHKLVSSFLLKYNGKSLIKNDEAGRKALIEGWLSIVGRQVPFMLRKMNW
jgi:hypothetical protein